MELTGKVSELVAKINGLSVILNEPISSVVIPGVGPVERGEFLDFQTPRDFLDVFDRTNALDLLEGVAGASINNGVLEFVAPTGNKG